MPSLPVSQCLLRGAESQSASLRAVEWLGEPTGGENEAAGAPGARGWVETCGPACRRERENDSADSVRGESDDPGACRTWHSRDYQADVSQGGTGQRLRDQASVGDSGEGRVRGVTDCGVAGVGLAVYSAACSDGARVHGVEGASGVSAFGGGVDGHRSRARADIGHAATATMAQAVHGSVVAAGAPRRRIFALRVMAHDAKRGASLIAGAIRMSQNFD